MRRGDEVNAAIINNIAEDLGLVTVGLTMAAEDSDPLVETNVINDTVEELLPEETAGEKNGEEETVVTAKVTEKIADEEDIVEETAPEVDDVFDDLEMIFDELELK